MSTTHKHSARPEEETNVVETIQSLIVAFALAMGVRSFVTEGFVIPTGSMAPTLMGLHVRVTSPDTGYTYPADAGPAAEIIGQLGPSFAAYPRELCDPMLSLQSTQRVGETTLGEVRRDARMGDRVLVLKYLYAFQQPARWDVVVFKNPTDPNGDAANFIKRLVGLPNEQLLMLDGDIFTAPLDADRSKFTIARKPEHVQRAVWQPVHDSDFMPIDPTGLAKKWGRAWRGAPWSTTGFDLGARGNARAWTHAGAGEATLSWQTDVLPIDDRTIERFDPKVAGRPDLMDGRTKLTVYPGMVYMSENAFINVKNASVDLVADVEVSGTRNHGVLLAQGGRFGGWSFWVDHGRPVYSYNFLGLEVFKVAATEAMADGKHSLKMAFDYDVAKGRGAGGTVSLFIDGKKVGEGNVGKTHANIFSLDDTADTGVDTGTPVDEAYGEGQGNAFTGVLEKVQVEVR